MQRSAVDLPDPDGPMTQMTSPLSTVSEKSSSTTWVPNALAMRSTTIISFTTELPLEPVREEGERQAHRQVEEGDQREHRHVLERRGSDQLAAARQLGDGDRRCDRRILEHHDHRVAVRRKEDADRLRQHDAPHHEWGAHAERLRRLDLTVVDRLDAGTEILRLVRRIGDA